jgi:TRAP-type mannitol/chloroaromatic compound transport system permease small subunit
MISKITRLAQISSIIDNFTQRLGKVASWFVSLLILLVSVIVVFRYGFSFGSIALQESVMYVNAAIFIFGAPYTLMTDGHVRVDVFYSRLGEKGKSFVNALGTLLLLMPAMILII